MQSGCSSSRPRGEVASVPGGAEPKTTEDFYKDRFANEEFNQILDDIESGALDTKAATPARNPEPIIDNSPPPTANLSKSFEVEQPVIEPEEIEREVRPKATLDDFRAKPIDPGEQRADLVSELASLLRDEANSPDWPVPALVRLAAMDLVEPGTFNSYYLGDGSGSMTNLHPRDVQTLSAWRDLFRNARSEFNSHGENADLAGVAQRFADQLTAQQALRVPTAKLCTKVDGFGLYTELPTYDGKYKLLAGRRHRLIIYTEVERFAHREKRQEGKLGYAVELTQDLSLYHAGHREDTLAWRKPNQVITDWSFNKRRDFFVVQIIDLPETLTVGSYRLKVRMTDEGAEPSAEDETAIEIDVVADASVFRK